MTPMLFTDKQNYLWSIQEDLNMFRMILFPTLCKKATNYIFVLFKSDVCLVSAVATGKGLYPVFEHLMLVGMDDGSTNHKKCVITPTRQAATFGGVEYFYMHILIVF